MAETQALGIISLPVSYPRPTPQRYQSVLEHPRLGAGEDACDGREE